MSNQIDYFDVGLHFLGRNNIPVFAINIGAMDGVTYDELIGYSNAYNHSVLYVEPMPHIFEELKNNISLKNAFFENSAISDREGTVEMLYIDPDTIKSGLVHGCFKGMSSIIPPRNGLGSEGDREVVEKYGKRATVSCITFEQLIAKHSISNIDVIKIDAEGHDYDIFKQINLDVYKPKIVRLEFINLSDAEKHEVTSKFDKSGYSYSVIDSDIVAASPEMVAMLNPDTGASNQSQVESSNVTIVTGLWNIRRDSLAEGWSRSYEHYLSKLEELLKIDNNIIIFGDSELKQFVQSRRINYNNNTLFVERSSSWFTNNEYYDKIQQIRTNPKWYNQVGWLADSTQAKLEMYNPLVMSKVFLLNDARIMDPFKSTHLVWVDAGITNTIHSGYFTHDKVQNKLSSLFDKFSFVCFPYHSETEVHGFEVQALNRYAGQRVSKVARGGLFGGPVESISEVNSIYYNTLIDTLNNGYMGTEESIFSILLYRYPDMFNHFMIEDNGLLGKFCEDVKNNQTKKISTLKATLHSLNQEKVGLYVIGFNSPEQLRVLLASYAKHPGFLKKTRNFLIDNSTDLATTPEYEDICRTYNFTHIKKDNLGICGGRQFVAEHFDSQTDLDYYIFLEDDMNLMPPNNEICVSGFGRYNENLYERALKIIHKEQYDFLKLSFSEFFGTNSVQWSWYNVPQTIREQYFPQKPQLPISGTDPDAPLVKYNNIKCFEGVAYADGEVYYCNWPQIVSRAGNQKMFLSTKWAHPYEQTWMSYIFQETKNNNIKGAVLLLSPINHHRFAFYESSMRKES